MKKPLALGLLGISLNSQVPSQDRAPGMNSLGVNKPLIGSLSLSADDPTVLAALACVKKNLPLLEIQSTILASQKLLSGVVVTIRCQVKSESGQEIWVFTVRRQGAGDWRLRSAVFVKLKGVV